MPACCHAQAALPAPCLPACKTHYLPPITSLAIEEKTAMNRADLDWVVGQGLDTCPDLFCQAWEEDLPQWVTYHHAMPAARNCGSEYLPSIKTQGPAAIYACNLPLALYLGGAAGLS